VTIGTNRRSVTGSQPGLTTIGDRRSCAATPPPEDATALVLTITGPLDAAGGRLVHEAAAAALDAGDDRIVEVDLRGATPLTVDGLRALARCAAFGRIRFRFGTP
jgi:hypothetical protein